MTDNRKPSFPVGYYLLANIIISLLLWAMLYLIFIE